MKVEDELIKSCFECGSTINIVEHHVVPRSSGGKKTVALCQVCHDLVHGISPRNISLSNLTKLGLERAKTRGVKLGPRNPKLSVKRMVEGSKKKSKEFADRLLPVIIEIQLSGEKTLQSVADRLNQLGYKTRRGKNFVPKQIWDILNRR